MRSSRAAGSFVKGLANRMLSRPGGFILAVSAAGSIAGLAAVLFVQGQGARVIMVDLATFLANLAAAAALFYAAKRSARQSRRLAAAWGVLALGQMSYTLGDFGYGYYEIVLHLTPFPSIADVFYLLYYPIVLIGVLLLPVRRLDRAEVIKSLLDMGIVILASILGFWNYLLGPLAAGGGKDSILVQLLSLAYPVGDLVLLFGFLMLLYRKSERQNQAPLLFLAAGFAVTIVTDCIFSYQSLLGAYASGGWLDLGWIFSYLLFGIAGIRQAAAGDGAGARDGPPVQDQASKNRLAPWVAFLPYAWLIAAYLLLVRSQAQRLPMDFSWIALAVGCIIAFVILRQVLTLRENTRLLEQLHGVLSRVQLQALDLSKTNQDLQVEISERKRAQEQLAYDAMHDALTGLSNRALMSERLRHAIEYGKRREDYAFSVLFMDLDHFKVVNDSLGHAIGDQLLVGIANRLRLCLRASDTVARLGGDEFVILLEDMAGAEDVTRSAERIQEKLKLPFDLQGHSVCISASIGIVLDGRGYDQPENILRDADIAMYQAKASGKSRFEIFKDSLRDRAIHRLALENDLRHALEHQELALYYQPIVALKTGRIAGFEALLRWFHPKRGLLNPSEFIPVAEETGLIVPMGRWALEQACRQLREWQTRHPGRPPLTMSVNVTGAQLTSPEFVAQVEGVLQETGIAGESLKLEITEKVCLNSSEAVISVFHALNHLGVHFDIDDFGTGYSSLSYLQNFPIRTIKIDRSFIQHMDRNAYHMNIIRTIIALAHDLGMDAVAEGIETRFQLDHLKKLGCRYGQGYLIGHPVDGEKTEELLVDLRNGVKPLPLPSPASGGVCPAQ